MKREDYLQDKDIKKFTHWLSKVIADQEKLNFHYTKTNQWNLLSEAYQNYKWPNRRTEWKALGGFIYPEDCQFSLIKDSDFKENEIVLKNLQEGLRIAFAKGKSAHPWLASIFMWGGVTSYNLVWLIKNKKKLYTILKKTYQAIQLQQDDTSNWEDLRFNAGMTKVYSLLCNDFIIYDTRVAAALAWLVLKWSKQLNKKIPNNLCFRCGSARTTKKMKIRNPDKEIFGRLVGGEYYALWNIRANWIITEALQLAKQNQPQLILDTSRKVEAALFMMGYDLQYALKPSNLDK